MLNCRVKAAGVILALGGTLLAGTALGQDEKIVLRVADHIPVTHILTEPMIKFWMKEVTRETGGKVEFEYYPAAPCFFTGSARRVGESCRSGSRKSCWRPARRPSGMCVR